MARLFDDAKAALSDCGACTAPDALTPAARAGRVVTMDGPLLLGFGIRTPEAVAELARALHPDTAPGVGL